MHRLTTAAEALVGALRSSHAPALGNEIEEHLRMGKVRTFRRGIDGSSEALEEIQKAAFTLRGDDPDEGASLRKTEEDESEPYSAQEQIEEALGLLTSGLKAQVAMADDAERIVRDEFHLEHVTLLIEDVDGGTFNVANSSRREGLAEWISRLPQIRAWLKGLDEQG